jgi:putative peptide zinc metalloprotease protein
MRFGPTSLQVSSVLAKGLHRPKLRSDLRISEQSVAGEKSYVIKILETSSYNRYGASEYELLTLCDGTRTPAEIAEELNRRHPDEPVSESEVLDFLDGIEPAMWERSIGEKNLAVLERIRDERKGRVDQTSVLYIGFKAWDPNKILTKIDPYLSWLFTPAFVVASLLLFIAFAYLLAGDWTRIASDTRALYNFQNKTAYDIWAFWFLLLAVGGIHELGHGLTCKHFGGDVHQMGFLLIYFTPAFFTDTTDILLFDRGSRRQWVIFAGIWIELTVCAISTLIWHFTLPGSIVNDLAYKTLLLSGIQGALLNLNPLIKADGYYALAQFLDIDNLREDAFAFLRAFGRKYLLREDMDLPPASRRLRRIYTIFGVAAIIYSVTLILLVLGLVRNILVGKFGTWGYLLTLAVVYLFARKGLKKAVPAVRAWLREKKEVYMAWKMTRAQRFSAIGVAFLLLIPPFPSRVSTDFTLEPSRDTHVRANVSGMIGQVLVHEGDQVEAGQTLAILENPEITADKEVAEKQLALANAQVRTAQERPQTKDAASAVRERTRLKEELAVAQKNEDWLEIRAPYDGVVKTRNLEQRVGEYLYAGDEFCQVVDRGTMRARVLVRDSELNYVRTGAAARMKVLSFPIRTYSGAVEQILPAAAADQPVAHPEKLERLGQELTNYFAVVVDFPNPDGSLREGMTGTAKISAGNSSMAWKAGREAWRWIRSQAW